MMRRLVLIAAPLALTAAAPGPTPPAPTHAAAAASEADIRAIVAEMEVQMRDGRTFAYRPLVTGDGHVAALEYWKAPGRPAIHPTEGEYAIVIDGAGTLVSGGTMPNAKETRPGLVEGERIVGGTTRTLARGDVILIPAGVPHWFGITGGKLVLLGMKLPVHAS